MVKANILLNTFWRLLQNYFYLMCCFSSIFPPLYIVANWPNADIIYTLTYMEILPSLNQNCVNTLCEHVRQSHVPHGNYAFSDMGNSFYKI